MSRKLSDEQVARLIQTATRESTDDSAPAGVAEEFVAAVGIIPGDHKIEHWLVWDAYLRWAHKPVSFIQFFSSFNKVFKQERWGSKRTVGRFYRLNPEPFDLSAEALWAHRRRVRDGIYRVRYKIKKKGNVRYRKKYRCKKGKAS